MTPEYKFCDDGKVILKNSEMLSQRHRETTPPAQPAPVQEPVKTGDTLSRQFMSEADKAGITHWPTPPAAQRQWVGLTEDEIEECASYGYRYDVVAVTEDKLKEKNT